MGRSRRGRATETAEDKLREAELCLRDAMQEAIAAKSKKCKALWQKALEKITSGHLELQGDKNGHETNGRVRNLWRWRRCLTVLAKHSRKRLPSLLLRGWRPTTNFFHSESFNRARYGVVSFLQLVLRHSCSFLFYFTGTTGGGYYSESRMEMPSASEIVLCQKNIEYRKKTLESLTGARIRQKTRIRL